MDISNIALQAPPIAPSPINLETVALCGLGLMMAVIAAVFFKRNYKAKEKKESEKNQEDLK